MHFFLSASEFFSYVFLCNCSTKNKVCKKAHCYWSERSLCNDKNDRPQLGGSKSVHNYAFKVSNFFPIIKDGKRPDIKNNIMAGFIYEKVKTLTFSILGLISGWFMGLIFFLDPGKYSDEIAFDLGRVKIITPSDLFPTQ